MTKTSKVTSMVSTEESQSFKRKRMKEIRSIVARAVKNNERIDLMDFTGTDIPRVMIALQDLVTTTQEKQKRATGHICNLVHELNDISHMSGLIIDGMFQAVQTKEQQVAELSSALYNERTELSIMNDHLQESHEHSISLHRELEGARAAVRELR